MALRSNKTRRKYSRIPAKKPSIDPDDFPVIHPIHNRIDPDDFPVPENRKEKIKK